MLRANDLENSQGKSGLKLPRLQLRFKRKTLGEKLMKNYNSVDRDLLDSGRKKIESNPSQERS